MWWDEALVPLIARFPVTSILEWLRSIEVHPPLYYLVIKTVMAFDQSDSALRLASAVPGVVCIYLIRRLGKDLFGPSAGLAAAAFVAANPYLVWLSRIVRPYSLYLMLLLLSLWGLASFLRTGSRRAFAGMLAANLALYWTHYMMVVLAPALGLVALGGTWPALRPFFAFTAACVASFLSILPFFLQNFDRPHWMGAGSPWDILTGVGVSVLKLGWFFKGPAAYGVAALAAVGLIAAARRWRGPLLAGLAIALVPVGVVMAGKLAWTHEPRYFLNILPVMALAAGLGFTRLTSAMRPALGQASCLVLALGMAAMIVARPDDFYKERSLLGTEWISYKVAAEMVPHLVKPGEPAMASDEGLYNTLDWHAERRGKGNPLRLSKIGPGDKEVVANFLWFERMGHLAATKTDLEGLFPGMVDLGEIGGLTFLKAVVQRSPVQRATALPWERTFVGPRDILSASHALERLTLTPYWGGELCPAQNGAPGFVEYAVRNASEQAVERVEISIRYANEGKGNTLRLLASFDGGEFKEVTASAGPDRHFYRRAFITPEKPFSLLTVRVEMDCAMRTAQYPGGNLGSLRLKSVLVALTPPKG